MEGGKGRRSTTTSGLLFSAFTPSLNEGTGVKARGGIGRRRWKKEIVVLRGRLKKGAKVA